MHLNNVVAHSIKYELAYAMQTQFSHHIGSMRLDRFHTQIEERRDILCTLALGQELHYLPLAGCQAAQPFLGRPDTL